LINPGTIPGVILLGMILVVASVFTKAVPAVAVLRRAAGLGIAAALPLAVVLIPRAEISLIIAQYGVSIGGTSDLLAIAMFVMIATALLPGALLSLGARLRGTARTPQPDLSDPPSPPSNGPPK